MTKTAGLLALGFAVLGLGASTAAAYVHYHMLNDPGYLSFCDVSATVSCTQVYASRYGSFMGIPVAVFGAIWFAFATLLAVAGVTAGPAVRESVPAYLFASSTLALSVILYLGYASFFILQTVCILCVITYAAVIGLFLVSGAVSTIPMLSLPRRAFQDLRLLVSNPLALALGLLLVGGAASTLAFFPREGGVMAAVPTPPAAAAVVEPASATGGTAPAADAGQDRRSDFERWYTSQPRVSLVVPNDGAKVLIVKFNDYQCPACGQSYLDYKPILAKYEAANPGAVKMVLKDYPLEMECNPNLQTAMHAGACEAAVAVRLARERNRAEAMEEWLYTHQQGMNADTVKQAAREVGQVTNFDARYQSVLPQVKADIAYGQTLVIKSTPTFFINGVKLEGALPAVYFDQAIAYELARAK
jgi:uncharacterized membrane protein/protein-disulfide isomerase